MNRLIEHILKDVQHIKMGARRKKESATVELSEDLRVIVNNPEYSDIVFVCNDGGRVHASRLFLVARSKVLHRMLLNGMAESRLSGIKLQEISSIELLLVMEYLYMGILKEHAPTDWKHACQILRAATFFALEGLELLIQDYLLEAANEVENDVNAVATYLSIMVEVVNLFGNAAIRVVANHLVWNLVFKSLRPEHLQALSTDALIFYLQATKVDAQVPKVLTTAEFMRFKNVVLWCACQQFAPEKSLTLETMPLEIQCMLERLEKSPYKQCPMTCDQSIMYSKIKDALDLSMKRHLPLVSFCHISPKFFVHIIQPMDIVLCCDMMNALGFYVLRTTCKMGKDIRGWSVGGITLYKQPSVGSWIQKVASGNAFALYNLALSQLCSDGRFEWEVTIEEVCNGFIKIGMHRGTAIEHHFNLSCALEGFAMCMDVSEIRTSKPFSFEVFTCYGKDCSRLVYDETYAHKNNKIKACLNLEDRQCFFVMNNENFEVTWSNMPEGTYFSAVSLDKRSKDKVKLRFLRIYGREFPTKSP